jgi:hypothetical protein
MRGVNRIPRSFADRPQGLAEVEALAWLLDNSIPVPGTGRRFGIDAVIGFVPVVGDLASGAIGLFVVWRGARLGLPRIVVARMLANSAIDIAIGAIPVIGDAFDLSTRSDWMILVGMLAVLVAVVALLGWFVASVLSAIAGAL